MRVLKTSLRGQEGEISLVPESIDDLWHLKYLIAPGDLVFALTHRKATASTDKLRPEKLERRPVRLGIRAESVEFHTSSNWLRVHGVIEVGPDVASYHTLNLEPGDDVSIIKRWRPDELARIKEAVAEAKRPKVVIALIEEGEAAIGVLRQFGVETASEIKMGGGKGMGGKGGDRRSEFLDEVAEEMNRVASSDTRVILAGPGFTKEDLKKRIDANYPDLSKRIILYDATTMGVSGFQEVLRRGAIDKILEESRLALESTLIEDLLREIATDGRAAYGPAEVREAAEQGAVETLMIFGELVRRPEIDELMRTVSDARGRVVVFSPEFEPGKRLEALGGVAAITRYKIHR
ncbi:MAG: mRNA surveillance protein pelota [Methanothrix sp.]|jgi:protein pelota|uniref:Protein pelota homolog n=1 Tax=Methanothrix harundinacea TaxID=301375 RepID=A0A101IG75_9EURY|nr:MAG: mRNA surveillance protein Pelota [Methanosaeta sp. SDB]KUK43699.1 MAG: Protein pelota-like protein [Methanothrix harundinacea]MDD2638296.1 mRNA surveillance protein pelota [Methanothrix sp.]MDI9398767.1 mRNA surveillance protein pelota [Euryarchaeota archaeon]KUK94671.1 MAG: Protein pelota-like protein [Methanothrix harundinacea]